MKALAPEIELLSEAAPIKCAGRESAGLPALSHTGHTKILVCSV